MRQALILGLILALGSLYGLAAETFHADAEATGTAVLWFTVEDVTADFRAQVTLSGTLLLDDVSVTFSASGRATGSGQGNLETLAVDATMALTADGTTQTGSRCSIQGGITVGAIDAGTMTSTSGRGSGHFYLLITTPAGRWTVEGEAVGGASGNFVVPDDPLSMQLEGSGSFSLSGELRPWSPAAEATLPEWPADLVLELERQAANVDDVPGD